eukprot:JP438874.1.p1 GENE.JP438874.1~~JP438874.1.p1  ORF type:complete len:133 (+),score=8.69 JP438874.1:21-419(+)
MSLNPPPPKVRADQLDDFMESLDTYVPTIPDDVTEYYLKTAGFNCPNTRVKRLVSLAAQKFISDVTNEAMQHYKIRQQAPGKKQKLSDSKVILTMEDVAPVLRDFGLNVQKPEYHTDTPGASSVSATADGKK